MNESSKWDLYDELIDLIPDDIKIEDCLTGLSWFLVRSIGVGIAMTPPEGQRDYCFTGKLIGAPVKEVARWVKSWNFFEAAMGLAAINSVLNAPKRLEKTLAVQWEDQPLADVFTYMREQVGGKKVAVIGHFRDLELLAPLCELSILERCPIPGDYPDPACEYILPQQDFVFITATTLINKTLPRLLELSQNAHVVLTGPSTPMTPSLFNYGIDMIAGTSVFDQQLVWRLMREGDRQDFFQKGGKMLQVTASDWLKQYR